jgi:hypothetical protein
MLSYAPNVGYDFGVLKYQSPIGSHPANASQSYSLTMEEITRAVSLTMIVRLLVRELKKIVTYTWARLRTENSYYYSRNRAIHSL